MLLFCALMFQFLIGTLKTCNTQVFWIPRYYVSIPHRYAKNDCSPTDFANFCMFQFLIGTLKTPALPGA